MFVGILVSRPGPDVIYVSGAGWVQYVHIPVTEGGGHNMPILCSILCPYYAHIAFLMSVPIWPYWNPIWAYLFLHMPIFCPYYYASPSMPIICPILWFTYAHIMPILCPHCGSGPCRLTHMRPFQGYGHIEYLPPPV